MDDIIEELKAHARVLHRAVQAGEPAALERMRALRERGREPTAIDAGRVKRADCLRTVARELGFAGWSHAAAVLGGSEQNDFGTVLHQPACSGHWNIWSASYDEARAIRHEHGGYLLPYKRQFMIVDRFYIESLGLAPDDPDWSEIERDWVKPRSPAARARLYGSLIRQLLAARRV